jgi:hypothetical protein
MYRITNEEPAFLIILAVNLMADVIYEQFRNAADREVKQRLLDEAKALLHRKLVLSVPPKKSDVAHHAVVVARMARKMGPLADFEGGLDDAFQSCYEVLTDDIEWNDSQSLGSLTKILARFDCLARDAQIALSAQFSQLSVTEKADAQHNASSEKIGDSDGSNNGHQLKGEDSDGDGDGDEDEDEDDNGDEGEDKSEDKSTGEGEGEDEDEDSSEFDYDAYESDSGEEGDDPDPTVEGDLSYNSIYCSGECPKPYFGSWKGRTLHQCVICNNCFLCEECYQKRLAYNTGVKREPGLLYCGINHKYVKGPIEGWKGVQNGLIVIEGEKPITFREWLDDLKETKWKKAWELFWLGEE